jgi:transposase InsO family protein
MILDIVAEAQRAGARLAKASTFIGVSARTVERWRQQPDGEDRRDGPHRRPRNALSAVEEKQVATVLTSCRFAGLSPKQLVPQLADEGLYLASESTMYRLQRKLGLRRTMRPSIGPRQPTRAKVVHRATGANQVWSWDITWLPTTIRGTYLFLYMVMDVWSRRIVGWCIDERESPDIAAALIRRICCDTGVDPQGLVLHSDNGKPMRGRTMLVTLQELGILPSFSRPHVSDDNPYSEALFRTLKHTPAYPKLPFADSASARSWVARFVAWYNSEHRHSAIRYVTPDQRHYGVDRSILARRSELYEHARRSTPERWSRRTRNWSPIELVVLNPEPALRSVAA